MNTSQEMLVANHLREQGTITSWQAFELYGITRLSAYILVLRRKGWNIKTENTTAKNRYGRSTTFATYSCV